MKYFDMLRRFKGLKYKGKGHEEQQNEEEKNANKTGTQENFGATGGDRKMSTKEGEKDGKESAPQEIDPKEDINNIENKFNPKREEAYWLEDLYDRLEKCLMMGKEPLERYSALFNQYKTDLDIEPEAYVKSLDDTATENGNAVHVLRDDIIKHQNLYDQIYKKRNR